MTPRGSREHALAEVEKVPHCFFAWLSSAKQHLQKFTQGIMGFCSKPLKGFWAFALAIRLEAIAIRLEALYTNMFLLH